MLPKHKYQSKEQAHITQSPITTMINDIPQIYRKVPHTHTVLFDTVRVYTPTALLRATLCCKQLT